MIYLRRHPDEHGGMDVRDAPVLCYWDGVTAGFADPKMLMTRGVLIDGQIVKEPVPFATAAEAAAVAIKCIGRCLVVDSTETRDGKGALVEINQKIGTALVEPPAKARPAIEVSADIKAQ